MNAPRRLLPLLFLMLGTLPAYAGGSCDPDKPKTEEYGLSCEASGDLEEVAPADQPDLETVAVWVAKKVIATKRASFTREEIKEGTGIDVTRFSQNQVMTAVLEWLSTNEEGLDFLAQSCEVHDGDGTE